MLAAGTRGAAAARCGRALGCLAAGPGLFLPVRRGGFIDREIGAEAAFLLPGDERPERRVRLAEFSGGGVGPVPVPVLPGAVPGNQLHEPARGPGRRLPVGPPVAVGVGPVPQAGEGSRSRPEHGVILPALNGLVDLVPVHPHGGASIRLRVWVRGLRRGRCAVWRCLRRGPGPGWVLPVGGCPGPSLAAGPGSGVPAAAAWSAASGMLGRRGRQGILRLVGLGCGKRTRHLPRGAVSQVAGHLIGRELLPVSSPPLARAGVVGRPGTAVAAGVQL